MIIRNPVLLSLFSAMVLAGCSAGHGKYGLAKRMLDKASFNLRGVSEESVAKSEFAVASARMAEERRDNEEAIHLYTEAISLNPGNADAWWRKAILFAKQENVEGANEAFKKAAELDKNNPSLFADYGYHLYLQGEFVEAEDVLRTAVRLAPDDQRACNNLGLALAANGNDEEAMAAFLDAGCSEASARSNLAFSQSLRNDVEAARESYQASLSLDPSSKTATAGLRQINKLDTMTAGAEEELPPVDELGESSAPAKLRLASFNDKSDAAHLTQQEPTTPRVNT